MTNEQAAFESQGYLIVGVDAPVPIGYVFEVMRRHFTDEEMIEQRQLVIGTATPEEFFEQACAFGTGSVEISPEIEAIHRQHYFYKVVAE